MWWTMVLAVQSVAGPPDVRPPRPSFPARCDEGEAGEGVVCGSADQDGFRLKPLADRYATTDALPQAETTIVGDLKVSAESEAGQAIGHAPPRAMVRLKLPF
jgi:hypothetical protein